jgi:hypothetical protein
VPTVIEGLYVKIAEPGYLGDLAKRPMAELRELRRECQHVEDALSYQRRLVQGRLDVIQAEHDRRAAGEPPADVSTLVEKLPTLLASGIAGPRRGHVMYELDFEDDVSVEVDAIVGPAQLADLASMTGAQLGVLTERLRELENAVSSRRRVVFERLDLLADEVGRRYRGGETSVEALLG